MHAVTSAPIARLPIWRWSPSASRSRYVRAASASFSSPSTDVSLRPRRCDASERACCLIRLPDDIPDDIPVDIAGGPPFRGRQQCRMTAFTARAQFTAAGRDTGFGRSQGVQDNTAVMHFEPAGVDTAHSDRRRSSIIVLVNGGERRARLQTHHRALADGSKGQRALADVDPFGTPVAPDVWRTMATASPTHAAVGNWPSIRATSIDTVDE